MNELQEKYNELVEKYNDLLWEIKKELRKNHKIVSSLYKTDLVRNGMLYTFMFDYLSELENDFEEYEEYTSK